MKHRQRDLISPALPSPGPAPLIGPSPGCWSCPLWQRRGSAIGVCHAPAPSPRRHALTSYVFLCRDHPGCRGAAEVPT